MARGSRDERCKRMQGQPQRRSKQDSAAGADSAPPGGPQISFLVETESTQTDDDLLQELLRRRRNYLNEQSRLGGLESKTVVQARQDADSFLAAASRRAREEAMSTVDASTSLKAALRTAPGDDSHSDQAQPDRVTAPPAGVTVQAAATRRNGNGFRLR